VGAIKIAAKNSPSGILIRRATTEDAADVANVYIASQRDAAGLIPVVHSDAEIRAWVVEHMVPERETWVADDSSRIVAVMVLDGEMIDQMYVSPGSQRRGVGDAMLAHAKQLHPARLRLYTFQSNAPARRFYEARGFIAIDFNDGSRNEERAPDVLYEWTP
jgi:ribosomal protein S18 acetylase RimI-like enzyme